MYRLIDTHAHLEEIENLESVIAEAKSAGVVAIVAVGSDCDGPERLVISAEQSEHIEKAIAELPYQQQEVIILHLQSGMRFKAIAESQGVSINTIQSRYRYGLDKLRSLLNIEVDK